MSTNTGIEWTNATWNPWHGCHKVSPGCKNCYMFRDKERYGQDPNVVVRSKTTFRDPMKWLKPRMIFTCSWSDWLIEEADPWREEAYEIIRATPQHTYQILTKRIDRARGRVPDPPLPNVWLGVSAENQQYADERIPLLLQTPAAVRFVSYEPALGRVDLRRVPFRPGRRLNIADGSALVIGGEGGVDFSFTTRQMLHWIIVGGESGPDARPFDLAWARSIVEQCREFGLACFVKQLGAFPCEEREVGTAKGGAHVPLTLRDRKGGDWEEWPIDLRIRDFPASAAREGAEVPTA